MKICLSDDREQFVRSLVQTGQYASEDEVVDAALRLLQECDDQAREAERTSPRDRDRHRSGRPWRTRPFDPNATCRASQSPGDRRRAILMADVRIGPGSESPPDFYRPFRAGPRSLIVPFLSTI